MIKNYFITAWRNLIKNKFYSVINIAGLTLGLAIGILILLWVQDELSFDTFHKNAKNIYRLDIRGGTGATKQIFDFGVSPILHYFQCSTSRLSKEITQSHSRTIILS